MQGRLNPKLLITALGFSPSFTRCTAMRRICSDISWLRMRPSILIGKR